MHSIVNGILSYGLLNVPVGVCSSARSKEITFKTLHKECEGTIGMPKVCKKCGEADLQVDQLVKGFEFSKKQYLMIEEDDLEKLQAERSKIIKINKFVSFDEVDELQVAGSYYLAPNAMLTRPYTLLSHAMGEKEVVGVGVQSLWGKEHPAMVWAKEGGALVLSSLFCHDEMVSDLEIQEQLGLVPEEEQELANQLIALMLRPLDPQKDFVSNSRRRMNEYIEAKLNNINLEFMEPETLPEATVDIQEQLRASIEAARSAA